MLVSVSMRNFFRIGCHFVVCLQMPRSFVERERSKILSLVFLRFVIVEKYEEQLAEVGLSG